MCMASTILRHRAALIAVAGAAALLAGAPAAMRALAAGPISINATELEAAPDPSLSFNGMANAMGLFAKYGLTYVAGPALGGGGPARVQAVATNNTEVGGSDIISVMGGVYSGAKIKILFVNTPYGDEEIWGSDKYKTLKDAVGQSWGVASLGGAQRFNAQLTVEGLGFKPDAFRWVAISGTDAARLQALDTGRTQITDLSHLGAALAKAKGFTEQVHVLVAHTSQHTPPIPRLVMVARADWLASNKEVATRYVETLLDANRRWESNADAWVDAAMKIYAQSGMTRDQLKAAWQEFHDGGYFSVNGGINLAATQKVVDLFFKLRNEGPNQYLKTAADIYDTGPLQAALDKMGVVSGTAGLPDTPDWYKKK
jgi:ABC-type nitrate/sulfonate/bicarbonate transport system substrate-binding protein